MSLLSSQRRANLLLYLYLLTIFFMPTQLGKHFWPESSYVLGLRVDYLSPTLYFTDILMLVLGGIFVLQFGKGLWKKLRVKSFDLGHLALCLLALTFAYSALFASRPSLVLYGAFKLFEMALFATVTAVVLKDEAFRVKVFYAFLVAMLFQSFLAIAQFVMQSSIGGAFYFFGERTFSGSTPGIATGVLGQRLVLRPYATSPHPNVLAGFLLISLLTTFYISQKENLKSRLADTVWALSSFVIFLSLSRLVISFTFLFWTIVFLSKSSLKKGRAIVLAFLLATVILTPFLFQRFAGLTLDSETVVLRERLFSNSLEIALRSPVFGVGQGHFLVNLPYYTTFYGGTMFLQPVHSVYFLVLSEWGILGIIALALGIYVMFLRIKKSKAPYKRQLYIIFLSILTIGFFDHYLLTLQQGQMLLAFSIGFIFALTPSKTFGPRDLEKYPKAKI